MNISLIICSRNRGKFLGETLQRLPHEALMTHGVELILVDNDSEDETATVMQDFAEKVSYPVRYEREATRGLSYARNRGIAQSRGEVLVFTDDDCYLREDYFYALKKHFDIARFRFCGGRILLWDPSDAEESVNYEEAFHFIPPRSFIPAGFIQGANMVVHRSVFDVAGHFDTALGAGTDMRCEDIELVGRASVHNFAGAFLPQLVVYHHHRRKGRAEVLPFRRDNDIGRGAYYAALSTQGFIKAWTAGVQLALQAQPKYGESPYFQIINELEGALRYFKHQEKYASS